MKEMKNRSLLLLAIALFVLSIQVVDAGTPEGGAINTPTAVCNTTLNGIGGLSNGFVTLMILLGVTMVIGFIGLLIFIINRNKEEVNPGVVLGIMALLVIGILILVMIVFAMGLGCKVFSNL